MSTTPSPPSTLPPLEGAPAATAVTTATAAAAAVTTAAATAAAATAPTVTDGAAVGGAGANPTHPSCSPRPELGNYRVTKLYGATTGVWCDKCNQLFFIPSSSVPKWVRDNHPHIYLTPRQLEAKCEREEQGLKNYRNMCQEMEE